MRGTGWQDVELSRLHVIGAALLWGVLVGLFDAGEVLARTWRDAGLHPSLAPDILLLLAGSVALYAWLAGLLVAAAEVVELLPRFRRHFTRIRWIALIGICAGLAAIPALVWNHLVAPFRAQGSLILLVADVTAVTVGVVLALAFALVLSHRPSNTVVASWLGIVTFVLANATFLIAWKSTGHGEAISVSSNSPPNIVFFSVDTLRADRLSVYGHSRSTSPNTETLAASGIVFEQCSSPSASTGPAHASLWTGKYPHEHGLRTNGQVLPDLETTVAEVLSQRGYETVGFATNLMVDARKGFAQGFDVYTTTGRKERLADSHFEKATHFFFWHALKASILLDALRSRDLVTAQVAHYLANDVRTPFFLFINYLDPHDPYDPPETALRPLQRTERRGDGSTTHLRAIRRGDHQVDSNEAKAIEDLYEAEIWRADHEVGQVMSALEKSGLRDNTLVVYWSDHGENMFEHGEIPGLEPDPDSSVGFGPAYRNYYQHVYQVYESVVHVALILSWPDQLPSGVRVRVPFGTVDIKDLLISLLEPENGSISRMPSLPQSDYFGEALAPTQSYFVRRGRWKLVRYVSKSDRWEELYDLEADPRETQSLHLAEPGTRLALADVLDSWLATHDEPYPGFDEQDSISLDEETRNQLRALGYLD